MLLYVVIVDPDKAIALNSHDISIGREGGGGGITSCGPRRDVMHVFIVPPFCAVFLANIVSPPNEASPET